LTVEGDWSMQPSGFYGWKLLAVLWLILFANFAFPMYGAGVINAYMAAALHFDRRTLGLAFAVFHWMHGIPGPLVAFCVLKKGARFTLMLGSLLICSGALAMALLVRNSVQIGIVFGVIIGLGTSAGGMLPTQSVMARWFVRRKAAAISLLLTGAGTGGIIAPLLLNRVISFAGGNWRVGWLLVSGLCLMTTLLALFFVKERPSDLGQVPDGRLDRGTASVEAKRGEGVYRTTRDWTFPEVLRSPVLWLLLVANLGYSFGVPAFLSHGIVHLRDLGHSPAEAASSFSVMAFSSLIGHFVVAALGDHIEPKLIWAAALLVSGVGFLLAVHATGAVGLYLCAVFLGIGFGSAIPAMMTVPANYFGPTPYPSVVGLILAFGTTVGAIGVYGSGFGYDHFGSYAGPFYLIASFCVLGSVLLLCIKPPRREVAPVLVATASSHS
jgi:sugar phosphate permease